MQQGELWREKTVLLGLWQKNPQRDWTVLFLSPWQAMGCRGALATLWTSDLCALCGRLENSSLSEPTIVQAAVWKGRVWTSMCHSELFPRIDPPCADSLSSFKTICLEGVSLPPCLWVIGLERRTWPPPSYVLSPSDLKGVSNSVFASGIVSQGKERSSQTCDSLRTGREKGELPPWIQHHQSKRVFTEPWAVLRLWGNG